MNILQIICEMEIKLGQYGQWKNNAANGEEEEETNRWDKRMILAQEIIERLKILNNTF